jgi:hypothetical protein
VRRPQAILNNFISSAVSISKKTGEKIGGEVADEGRSEADCGELREVAGAVEQAANAG